jgi:hypothetical protein
VPQEVPNSAPLQSWEQIIGEPNHWFDRFDKYRRLGPQRTLEAVFLAEWESKGRQGKAPRPPKQWYYACREWSWKERAAAWDTQVRKQDADRDTQRRIEHDRRLWEAREKLLEKSLAAMEKVDLATVHLGSIAYAIDMLVRTRRDDHGTTDPKALLRELIEIDKSVDAIALPPGAVPPLVPPGQVQNNSRWAAIGEDGTGET